MELKKYNGFTNTFISQSSHRGYHLTDTVKLQPGHSHYLPKPASSLYTIPSSPTQHRKTACWISADKVTGHRRYSTVLLSISICSFYYVFQFNILSVQWSLAVNVNQTVWMVVCSAIGIHVFLSGAVLSIYISHT